MTDNKLKSSIITHIDNLLSEKIVALAEQIRATEQSQQNDTKSSAGDKFETGREMLQAELNKYEDQRAKLEQSLKALRSICIEKTSKSIAFGSIIKTNNGLYFMALGLGKLTINNKVVYAISLASPIGQVFRHKKKGDSIIFQERKIVVEEVF